MNDVYTSVLEMIGHTPLLRINNIDTGPCELWVKMESQNPGGSVKDRIGLSMIEAAERAGRLKPGGTLIEATAGNTGLGLALVAAQKGYKLILVNPDKMSQDKIFHLKALGVDVRLTRSDVAKGHPEYYQDVAERLTREIPGAIWINQFANPDNPVAHTTGTGPEIWEQMDHRLDAVVCGVGSGGTLTGLGRFFQSVDPDIEMVLADPEGSVLAETVRTGVMPEHVGSWLVEGIGEDFVPPNCDLSLVSEAITVNDQEAFAAIRELLSLEGVLGGSSTGTLLAAALKYCRRQSKPKRVVTLVCDTGNKYLSKAFNPVWLVDQGLMRRDPAGDLRDLISRRADRGEAIVLEPDDPLTTAYARMRLYDVSQLPVLAGEQIVGIVDESDLLMAVAADPDRFGDPVRETMVTKLQVIAPTKSIDDLIPIFRADKVALVADGEQFYGLITKVDLINHLRRQADAAHQVEAAHD